MSPSVVDVEHHTPRARSLAPAASLAPPSLALALAPARAASPSLPVRAPKIEAPLSLRATVPVTAPGPSLVAIIVGWAIAIAAIVAVCVLV